MATQIFVNLPVKNIEQSKTFFSTIGYTFKPEFTNEQGACMIVSDTIFVMLLAENFFRTFTKKQLADATKMTESIICLSMENRQDVNEIVHKAVAAGASKSKEPQEHGFMYEWGFEDIDGHLWEFVCMENPGGEKA